MSEFLVHHPGLLFVIATLLPLASFAILLLGGGIRCFVRTSREGSFGATVFNLLGGPNPGRVAAYVATGAIGLACVLSVTGFALYAGTEGAHHKEVRQLEDELLELKNKHSHSRKDPAKQAKLDLEIKETADKLAVAQSHWSGRYAWAWVGQGDNDLQPGTLLTVGYRIDSLAAVMFVMVTLIATLIHLFSAGYMSEELQPEVEDHQVHTAHGHYHRRGRFGRFFLYLSLFCFSMLNLVLADNLFQVFVSWELVGVCSFLLIGFYFERTSASNAANKAFITNRIGDAGFIIGLMIIWTYVGTFNIEDLFAQIRSPLQNSHGDGLALAGQIVHAKFDSKDSASGDSTYTVTKPGEGQFAVLFRQDLPYHFDGVDVGSQVVVHSGSARGSHDFRPRVMPYWLLVVAGLGVFLGCVGKSAQFPLQVWLPDAMEGPTPVSALIHAATMVAAGVYLVARVFPLFTPEALLVIAYTGAITLTVGATIALVMTDIKKVLAYSTVSQLGYMMLALGVGGWVAGLFHLVTHAFFKALLFLGSGSVIHGCHHEQDMTKMGGLYPKMKITALTMLVGVLAISGIPLFSGWYSKDAVLAAALGFALEQNQHFLLFLLPLFGAGLTTFYMFRMWFMTFAGEPRDHHVHEHAHESPWTMTVPLIVLAIGSFCVAWGWPMWDPEKSYLESLLHHSQPIAVMADYGVDGLHGEGELWKGGDGKVFHETRRGFAHENHSLAGANALLLVAIGLSFAFMVYYFRAFDPAEAMEQFKRAHQFLANKWYFDEFYSAVLVRPALRVGMWAAWFDAHVIDWIIDNTANVSVWWSWLVGLFDFGIVDGLVNLIARVMQGAAARLRTVQTGYLRSYVLFLVVAAVALWLVLRALLA